jgi:TPR repeat protein
MTLKDLLKRHKADRQADVQPESSRNAGALGGGEAQQQQQEEGNLPTFTFMRTTTSTQEIISPPTYPGDRSKENLQSATLSPSSPKRLSRFRRHSNAAAQESSSPSSTSDNRSSVENKRLSERLHLSRRSRSASTGSVNIPSDLPEPTGAVGQEEDKWEERATILARRNPNQEGGATIATPVSSHRTPSREEVAHGDDDIQEAIRLHEEGDLTLSTQMFGRLADPAGANNALSQVLYGLALRHGWGIPKDEGRAITYLSAAASNSANIEELALQAGMKTGGLAKGELTLAIFELANCFRNGWGVKVDQVAAKQYYETAANMGDTDAMNEVAW